MPFQLLVEHQNRDLHRGFPGTPSQLLHGQGCSLPFINHSLVFSMSFIYYPPFLGRIAVNQVRVIFQTVIFL